MDELNERKRKKERRGIEIELREHKDGERQKGKREGSGEKNQRAVTLNFTPTQAEGLAHEEDYSRKYRNHR